MIVSLFLLVNQNSLSHAKNIFFTNIFNIRYLFLLLESKFLSFLKLKVDRFKYKIKPSIREEGLSDI